MPVVTDTEAIPLTPVYTIVISESGEATVDGYPIDKLPGQDAREAALSDVQERAARRGHPVRVVAKDPDGSWPMIVDYDGAVTVLDSPHPKPAHPPASPPAVGPTAKLPQQQADLRVTAEAAPLPPPTGEPVSPAKTGPPVGWADPLPADFLEMLDAVRAADEQGDLAAAAVAAQDLEDALDDAFGPVHPYTVNVLAVRANLAQRMPDWPAALELFMQAAERRHQEDAPREETLRLARGAHFAWKHLVLPGKACDPAAARQHSGELLRVLKFVGSEPVIVESTERWASWLMLAAS
ncbi:hypothetical protein [Streptomyces sp. MJM1172]|uniref:hypothetical protein n=1 Tax=Streptomyces sp. MJM1172 TaxID=1703926 RepID=UPI000940118D|nr:hypothetical protein [Streptomyces sp. MJM1172]OKI50339.1 hypothetical protein AMK15_32820 [Streptomyces sp. MJM1172]